MLNYYIGIAFIFIYISNFNWLLDLHSFLLLFVQNFLSLSPKPKKTHNSLHPKTNQMTMQAHTFTQVAFTHMH